MARGNHRRRRRPALVLLWATVVVLALFAISSDTVALPASDLPAVAAAAPSGDICRHDCVGAGAPCVQHGLCPPVALPAIQPAPAFPANTAVPEPVDPALKPHAPAVLLHPPDAARI